MSLIGNLIVRVGCDVSSMIDGFSKASGHTDKFASDVAKGSAIGSMMGGLMAKGIEKGVEAVKWLAESVIQTAEEMDKLMESAQAFGVSLESFQVLSYSAQVAGSDIAGLEKFMRKMTLSISEAAEAGGNNVFTRLGLDAQKLSGMTIDKQFDAVLAKIQEIESTSDRIGTANDIFGKGSMPILNMESQSKTKTDMEDVGGIVGDNEIAKLARFADELEKLWVGVKAIGIKLVALFGDLGSGIVIALQEVVWVINKIIDGLTWIYNKLGGNWKIDPPINEESGQAARKLAEDVEKLNTKLETEKATIGMTAGEIERYNLQKRGASESSLKHAAQLEKEISSIKKANDESKKAAEEFEKICQKKEEEFDKLAEKYTKDSKSPAENLIEDVMTLNQLMTEGRISWDTYNKSIERTKAGLSKDFKPGSTEPNYAMQGGSREMYDLLAKIAADKERREYENEMFNEAQKHTAVLQEIKDNTGSKPEVVKL